MSSVNDNSDSASEFSSTSPLHEDDCDFHHSEREGLCNSRTLLGSLCKYQAKVTVPGNLPVCKTHRFHIQKAGNCQAVEACGQLCNRPAIYSPPYHLCMKHQTGSDTLPCHLMRLPTELRLMILRYLFPSTLSHDIRGVKTAILKINRQLHQEASSVLYGESTFTAVVRSDFITILGKTWHREPLMKNKDSKFSAKDVLCHSGVKLIRNLKVNIKVGVKNRKPPRGIDMRGITQEEHELYAARHSVRTMVELIEVQPDTRSGNRTNLKRLTVIPVLAQGYHWAYDEAIAAIYLVIEPFQLLRGIKRTVLRDPVVDCWGYEQQFITNVAVNEEHTKLKKLWLDSLHGSTAVAQSLRNDPAVSEAYRKIEQFAQLTFYHDVIGERSWHSNTFAGIERPLHLARLALENKDITVLNKIQDAIKMRWINSQRQQQHALQRVADSIDTMFDRDNDENETQDGVQRLDQDGAIVRTTRPCELYPDVFQFTKEQPLPQKLKPSITWQELDVRDDIPKAGDLSLTTSYNGTMVTFLKNGQECTRLRTPEIVRRTRNQKATQA